MHCGGAGWVALQVHVAAPVPSGAGEHAVKEASSGKLERARARDRPAVCCAHPAQHLQMWPQHTLLRCPSKSAAQVVATSAAHRAYHRTESTARSVHSTCALCRPGHRRLRRHVPTGARAAGARAGGRCAGARRAHSRWGRPPRRPGAVLSPYDRGRRHAGHAGVARGDVRAADDGCQVLQRRPCGAPVTLRLPGRCVTTAWSRAGAGERRTRTGRATGMRSVQVELANDCDFGLGSACFAGSQARAVKVGRGIKAGMFVANDFACNAMCQSLPFGGIKESGFDRSAPRPPAQANTMLCRAVCCAVGLPRLLCQTLPMRFHIL